MEKIAYTVKEAAAALGVGPNAIYTMARRADFPAVKKGKQILIPVKLFQEWFERQVGTDVLQ